MFTGIIEELGTVSGVEQLNDSIRLEVTGKLVRTDLSQGDSVSVNGTCLTAAELTKDGFVADVMLETLNRTSLSGITEGDRVNLERAMSGAGRFGGHVVQGHVDGVAEIISREPSANWEVVKVRIPSDLTKYVVHKGSITFDGVSLTVNEISGDVVSLSLIPETLRLTTLGQKGVGAKLNVEADILAKHIEKLIEARSQK
ncbi:MAG: riboflavin synthase [Actinobacteria bacterium]|jgi:riboflavin synthase|uniref:Riboflavin synthase n=1 Tax=freshwater metagenome TaxID=449393 RepID=A0A6J6CAP1_9ZZZZ|nr:riboflavin synthase [Actinomycetota bacterium]